jgi:hypothetical protein
MTIDTTRLVTILKDALLRELGDEVDLIFRYGSTIKGTAHAYSDLDISYTPTHEETWYSITVMVEDVLCDLYPIHWSKLEAMASFDDISTTVLLDNQIVYARSPEVAERFKRLSARLQEMQMPEARSEMVQKALAYFQRTGYPFYLLWEAASKGDLLVCLKESGSILRTVLHCLAVCNQRPIDTRKLAQVLALPRLPENFELRAGRLVEARTPEDILAATGELLSAARKLLLELQREALKEEVTFPQVFDSFYPEFKGGLQHVILAAEREDLSCMPLAELYHELMIHLAKAKSGVSYSSFNSLMDYEQDLEALGFPDLLGPAIDQDFGTVKERCIEFDRRLRAYLTEQQVRMGTFESTGDLEKFLKSRK